MYVCAYLATFFSCGNNNIISHQRWIFPWGRHGFHPQLTLRTTPPLHRNLTRWPLQPPPTWPAPFLLLAVRLILRWLIIKGVKKVIRIHTCLSAHQRRRHFHVLWRLSLATKSAAHARCKSCTSTIAYRFHVPNNDSLWICALSLCAPQKPSCSVFVAPQTPTKIDEQRRGFGDACMLAVPTECASPSGDHSQQINFNKFCTGAVQGAFTASHKWLLSRKSLFIKYFFLRVSFMVTNRWWMKFWNSKKFEFEARANDAHGVRPGSIAVWASGRDGAAPYKARSEAVDRGADCGMCVWGEPSCFSRWLCFPPWHSPRVQRVCLACALAEAPWAVIVLLGRGGKHIHGLPKKTFVPWLIDLTWSPKDPLRDQRTL